MMTTIIDYEYNNIIRYMFSFFRKALLLVVFYTFYVKCNVNNKYTSNLVFTNFLAILSVLAGFSTHWTAFLPPVVNRTTDVLPKEVYNVVIDINMIVV